MNSFVGKTTTYGLDTENGATIQELQEKSPISGKKMRKLLLESEKMKVKIKTFSKTTRVDETGRRTIRAGSLHRGSVPTTSENATVPR